jgi:hypothetical protein
LVERLHSVWNLWGSILVRDVAMVAAVGCSESEAYLMSLWFKAMVFNATFNSISVISWRSVLLARTGVHGENHGPAVSHGQTLSHVMLHQVHLVWAGFELTTLVVIGTDCIGIYQGRIQDFKLGGVHLKKLRRAEGGANILRYIVWKITILLQKIISLFINPATIRSRPRRP